MATERRRQLSDGTSGSRHRVHLLSGLPVTERRLQVAGVSTSVLEGGAGSPILFLHGPGDFAGMWMRVIPDLVTTHRIPPHPPQHVQDGEAHHQRDRTIGVGALGHHTVGPEDRAGDRGRDGKHATCALWKQVACCIDDGGDQAGCAGKRQVSGVGHEASKDDLSGD